MSVESHRDGPGRVSMTRDGRIGDGDAAAARLLRCPRAALAGRAFREFVAPAYAALFDAFLARAAAGGLPDAIALGLAADGGTPQVVLLEAVRGGSGPDLDVALIELRAAGAGGAAGAGLSARALADALPALVAYWTRTLRCTFANRAYLEWFGRAPEQVVGLEIIELLGAELFAMNEPYIRAALRGEPQSFERALRKANGEIGYTWAQYVPDVADGLVQGFYVLVSDITDLKAAQRAALESEARFHAVIDASPLAYALVDAAGGISYLNPAFQRTFGYAREDVPTLERWWQVAVPDDAERGRVLDAWQARLGTARALQRDFEPLELSIRSRDGAERVVMARAALLGRAGGGTGLIALRDVTEERRLERQVLDAATREQHRFGVELHEHLAQDLAAASMRLDVLRAHAALGTEGVADADLAELADHLRDCVERTRAMARALSPVELGFGGLPGALERLAASIRARRRLPVEVVLAGFEHGTLEPLVTEHVYRIAYEALANAAGHSRGTRLRIEATLAADRLVLTVADNGIGLADPARARGPGFSIMRYRARAVGGLLGVEVAPGGGTIVRLSCPLRSEGSVLQASEVLAHDRAIVTWH